MSKDSDGSYGHVLKYTGVFGGVQGLNILLGLVRNKIVALLLGPSGMGLASLFGTTVDFVSKSTNFGVPFTGVRRLSALYDSGDASALEREVMVVRAWCLLTALFGMLVCVALGPFLSQTAFAWGDHSLHFMLLSPAVGMLAVTGGETAILKALRRLGVLAYVQLFTAIAALFVSVPIYALFGEAGIVPVIVITAFITMLLTLRRSLQVQPLQLSWEKHLVGEGMGMIVLGVAYTLAAIAGSGAEMVIRSYLNVQGDLDILGLYNAGYLLTITYAGMVFSAMDTDFFPRLSAVQQDVAATNLTVNRQMEVSLLLLSPMLAVLIIALPVLIPLLYSARFLPVVAMAQVAALAMYLKVLTLPVAYITLARAKSMAFLLLEVSYFIVLVVLMIFCFERWGLLGTGIALLLAHLFDYVLINGYAYMKYGYRCSVTVFRYAFVQLSLGAFAYVLTLTASGLAYWLLGAVIVLLSGLFSLQVLRRKTHLWEALTRRFRR